jgi:ribosomal protein S25
MDGVGSTSTSITDDDKEGIRDVIPQNRWVTVNEVAHQLQISHGAAYEIIQNRLAFHKFCVR